MRRIFVLYLLMVLALLCLANYGYFSRAGLLRLGEELTFTVYGEDLQAVMLTIREVKNNDVLLSKLLGEQVDVSPWLGKVVVRRTYKPAKDWETFSLKTNAPGTYYATLTRKDERGREVVLDETFLVVTDIEAIQFSDGERTIVCVMKQDGGFVNDAEVLFYKDSKLVGKARTDSKGMASCEFACDLFYVRKDRSSIFGEIYSPFKEEYADEKLFLLTDRPVYKPNDIVKFRGQLFSKNGSFYQALGASSVKLIVKDPKDNEAYAKDLTTDDLGGFFDEFNIPESAAVGVYEIEIVHGDRTYYGNFMVEEYRKPEYKISIETPEGPVFANQTLRFTIYVNYFNGQPVAHAQVAYYVQANPFYENPFLAYRGLELTDENGKITVEVKIDEGFDGYYTIEAIATDESQRQVEERKSVRVWPADVNIQLEEEYIWTSPGQRLKITVSVTNVTGEPLDGTLTAEVDGAVQEVQVTNGKAEFTFVPEKPKTYNVELIFGKAKKRLTIHAFGEGYTPSELMLICDQKKLQPGQTFQLQLVSSYRFTGLVAVLAERIYQIVPVDTFERASIQLKAPEGIFEKNLFIVFLGLENGKRVEKELKIPVERALNVSSLKISFDKAKYDPGEFATVRIEADAASVCLMLVDEAIYAMIGQEPPSLEEFLYPENDYPAVTYDFAQTWRLYSLTDRVYAELLSKEVSFEDFKKSAVMEKINVREYFPDTALWIPSLRLEQGVATLRFKVPDSITTFRATAYGFSKSLFSQGSGSMLVTKPFYVRPSLPTFFREGDVVRTGATIFNRTDEALKVSYWVELPNALRAMQDVSGETVVQPNSSFTLSYSVRAIQPLDPSTLTFYAVSKWTDAIALNVPVKPFAFEREYYSLETIDGKKKSLTLPDAEYVQAKLRVLTSVVPILAKSIEKLIHYPYGCTEQTMSSFLPAIVATKMGLKIENLDEIVQKGLFRLYDHQHSDGGWGWWKTDESLPLMSAYVMEGLYYAREAGYHVPDSVVRRGMEYLSNNLTGYSAYVLSLYGVNGVDFQPKNAVDFIFGSMLSAEYLQRALEFVEENEKFARVRVDFDDYSISEIQLSSVLLRSLMKWQKDSPLVPKLINYLLSEKDGYFWYSTKDTSYSVMALLEALPSYDRPLVWIRNNEKEFFLDTEGEVSLEKGSLEIQGQGLVEVHVVYLECPVTAVREGLRIERRFYKRYELYLEKDRQLIDAFVLLGSDLVPTAIERVEPSDRILRVYAHEYDGIKSFEHNGVKFTVMDDRLTLFNVTYEFEKLLASSGWIVAKLRNDAVLVCDTNSKRISMEQGVRDVALLGSNVLKLKKNALLMNETVLTKVPDDVEEMTCTDREILLKAKDKTYWLKDGNLVELCFMARFVEEWDGERLVASDIKFSGNESVLDGTFKITFKHEPVKLRAGDIVKTVLTVSECDGQYLIVEDFFPSCAQVLSEYTERTLHSSDKFSYGWYRPWRFWYSARELHEDRIAFFATRWWNDTFSYVWRVTADGIYQLLPARVYSMYKKGLYAHSDPCVLHVGMDSEDLAGE